MRRHINDRAHEAVSQYVLQRMREQGDVFGWAPMADGEALLLISELAISDSFPEEIAGIHIALKVVPTPQHQLVEQ